MPDHEYNLGLLKIRYCRKMVGLLKFGLVIGFLTGAGWLLLFRDEKTVESSNIDIVLHNNDESLHRDADKLTEVAKENKGSASDRNNLAEKQIHDVQDNELRDAAIKETIESQIEHNTHGNYDLTSKVPKISYTLNMALVACGDHLNLTLTAIKSTVMTSQQPFHVHIFADDPLQNDLRMILDEWPATKTGQLKYSLHKITFPLGNEKEWRELFKPCATQRLFLPMLLPDVDSLLYIDTDVVLLHPLEEIWKFFGKFNTTQLAALAPEHEDAHTSWYKRFARHPYYPPLGVNSGVMLMNLTRMRQTSWLETIVPYLGQYKYQIIWGDQDLINIFFHFYPEQLYIYPCQWNYRPDHCMYMSVCKEAENEGIHVIHGCRGSFINDKQPTFKAVYEAIHEHSFQSSLEELADSIDKHIRNMPAEKLKCREVEHLFSKGLRNVIKSSFE